MNILFERFPQVMLYEMGGYSAIAGAGRAMHLTDSSSQTFPVAPMSSKDIFGRRWSAFMIGVIVFYEWPFLVCCTEIIQNDTCRFLYIDDHQR
jgi:hypothetical protein